MKPITFEMIERAFKYILNRWFQPPTGYPKRYVNLNEFKIVQTYARLYNVPQITSEVVDLALKDYSLHPEKYRSIV